MTPNVEPCCSARRAPSHDEPQGKPQLIPQLRRSTEGQVFLPGGVFLMGDSFDEGYPDDGESPVHSVEVSPFWLDATSVTNAQFARFVKETGYLTDAERFGTSAVFHLDVAAPRADILGRAAPIPWWLNVRGANWQHPEGALSDLSTRLDHPVVHVSWSDASAYADWAGKRLPTEAEWEFAARSKLEGHRFPWGNELTPDNEWQCNIWQGNFPYRNDSLDGFRTTAPARSFHRNAYGIWNMIGNVWEWCADWFSASTYALRRGEETSNPEGPLTGPGRVMRGGSFLCHASYCYRYRVAARSLNTPDSSSSNMGFRCANNDQ